LCEPAATHILLSCLAGFFRVWQHPLMSTAAAEGGGVLQQLAQGSFGTKTMRPSGIKVEREKPGCTPASGELAPRVPMPDAEAGTTGGHRGWLPERAEGADDADQEISPEALQALAEQIAAGEADEGGLETAADCLLMALPESADPDGFFIPAGADVDAEGALRCRRGVPLRLCAEHPEVAWLVHGELQTLIGAARKTGDPSDVW